MKKGDDLRDIKELLEIVKHKVDLMEVSRSSTLASIHLMKDQQSVMNKKLDELKESQDAMAGDIEHLLDDVKGIRDEIGLWHGRDKREIDEIKKHLNMPIISDIPE